MSSWDGLEEFVAVAQARSFSAAAGKLGRSSSQVSRDIAALEQRLGSRLLYRTTRHVSLTDTGEVFLQACVRLVEARDEAVRAVTAEDGELTGRIRLTCAIAYGERFIVPLVNEFALRHPRLSVDIDLSDGVVDLVREGFDLAIRFGRLRDSRLVASRLTSRHRILCASPDYLAAAGTPRSLADLDHHSCLRGEADIWTFDRDGKRYDFRPSGRWRCNSGSAVLDAALRGLGICRMPDFYVAEHLKSGALVSLLEMHQPEDEPVWLVRPSGRGAPLKVRRLVDHLTARFNPESARP